MLEQGHHRNGGPLSRTLVKLLAMGVRPDYNLEVIRRVKLLNLTAYIAILIIVVLGFQCLARDKFGLAMVNLGTALAWTSVLIYHVRTGRHGRTAGWIMFFACALLLYLFATGGMGNSGFLWYYPLPIIALFLLGLRNGGLVVAFMTLAALVLHLLPEGALPGLTSYPVDIMSRFFPSFILLALCCYMFEKLRLESQDKLAAKNEELDRATQGLRAKNDELQREIGRRRAVEARLLRTQKEALAANEAKSLFLANMSHEIRTPMNAIIGMNQLALESELTHEQRHFLETVKNSAESLLLLLNDILDFSKIEAGQLELDLHAINLENVVMEAGRTMEIQAAQKGLALLCRIRPGTPLNLHGDGLRLKQILLNLISNAVKFTQEGYVLVGVDLERLEGIRAVLRFRVTDTGMGIDPARRKAIFDDFTQADSSVSRTHGGTGLGLAISRRLAEQMGGRLWCASQPGQGSTFHLSVVMELAEHNRPPAIGAKECARPLLLVGQRSIRRQLLLEMLASRGFTVVVANSREQALDRLAAAPGRHALIVSCLALLEPGAPRLQELAAAWPPILFIKDKPDVSLCQCCAGLGIAFCLPSLVGGCELASTVVRILGGERCGYEPSSAAGRKVGAKPAGPGLAILLAEDNPANQDFARVLLGRHGHRVIVAANGIEALEAMARQDFDLVLMDVQMPRMDGLSATRFLRACERGEAAGGANLDRLCRELTARTKGRHTPVVAMTAQAMAGDRDNCLRAGMDDYLTKPIRQDALDAVLEGLQPLTAPPAPRKSESPALRPEPKAVRLETLPARRPAHVPAPPPESPTLVAEPVAEIDPADPVALHLARNYGMTPAEIANLIGISRQSIPEMFDRAVVALKTGDMETLSREAHSIKSSARLLGMEAAGELALKIEKAAGAGRKAPYAAMLQELRQALSSLLGGEG